MIEIVPAYEESGIRIELFGDEVERISAFDPLTGKTTGRLAQVAIYPSSHYVTPQPRLETAVKTIEAELMEVKPALEGTRQAARGAAALPAHDVRPRDAARDRALPRHRELLAPPLGPQAGRAAADAARLLPEGLADGDRRVAPVGAAGARDVPRRPPRKKTLVEYGFRLPSALDNRPLNFEEFEERLGQVIYVSATPGPYELQKAGGVVVEQVIRPTGLMDPEIDVRPVKGQVDDLLAEIRTRAARGERVLVTTLTKRMAEDLTEYYHDLGVRVRYLHSDIETLERVQILRDLRKGEFDVLVGINLLREGLDLPEVSLVAVLDADKEGFLRSAGSLIQTIGRAARNVAGQAILYADQETDSMKAAIGETDRRRTRQQEYNREHDITPESIKKSIGDLLSSVYEHDYAEIPQVEEDAEARYRSLDDLEAEIKSVEKQMREAAKALEFEKAAELRDRLKKLRAREFGLK